MCMLRQGCSLTMLHRTCEKLHGSVTLGGLSMPNIMHMPFFLSPEVLRSILPHMRCKLNLPIYVLSVGLLTLIYIDSLIVLAVPWSSLHIIWKFSWVIVWPVLWLWLYIGDGSFRCSLDLSPKVLEVSSIYSSSHVRSLHWNQKMAPLLFSMGSLSLGETRRV